MFYSILPNEARDATRSAPVERQPEGFDPEKALDTPGFAAFYTEVLNKRGEQLDPEEVDRADMETCFKAFQAKKTIIAGYEKIYRDDFKERFGVVMNKKDLEAVSRVIEEKIKEEPGEVLQMQANLETMVQNARFMDQKRKNLANYYSKEELQNRRVEREEALRREEEGLREREKRGFWGWEIGSKTKRGYRKDIKKIEGELVAIEHALAVHANYEISKRELEDARMEVFEMAEMADEVHEKAKEVLLKEFADLNKPVDRLHGLLDKLDKIEKDADSTNRPLLELDEIENVRTELQDTIEDKVTEELRKAIKSIPDTSSLTLKRVNMALASFMKRQERVGMKKGEEAKEWVKQMLSEVAQEPGVSDSKKFLLAYVRSKIS